MQQPNHQRGSQRAQLALQACFAKKNTVYGSSSTSSESLVPKKTSFALPMATNNQEDLMAELGRFNDENSNSNIIHPKPSSSSSATDKPSITMAPGSQASFFSMVSEVPKPASTNPLRPNDATSGNDATRNGSLMTSKSSFPSLTSSSSVSITNSYGHNNSSQQLPRATQNQYPTQQNTIKNSQVLTQNSILSQSRNSPSRIQNYFQQRLQSASSAAVSSSSNTTNSVAVTHTTSSLPQAQNQPLFRQPTITSSNVGRQSNVVSSCMPTVTSSLSSSSSSTVMTTAHSSSTALASLPHATATSHAPATITRNNVWSEPEGEVIESSMCFSIFEGRVTSMCTTRDGAYLIAGFSNGYIRLFDMTTNGHGDPQDRIGFPIGKIDGSNMQGSLQLHLELAEEAVSDSNTLGVCHLFAGVVQGSTKMLVVDIRNLRALKRRRGFLSSDFKCFLKESSKLRGFMSLNVVSTVSMANNLSHQGDTDSLSGYTAKYRLLCGKGYGSFSLWDITLSAHANTLNGELTYTDNWQCIASGSSSSQCIRFACFVSQSLPEATSDLVYWGGSSSSEAFVESQDIFRGENILSCFDEMDENSNMQHIGHCDRSSQPSEMDFEILFLPIAKSFRTCLISYDSKSMETVSNSASVSTAGTAKAQKVKIVGGCNQVQSLSDVHCASKDGTILFSGLDTLTVCKYLPSICHNGSNVSGMGSVVAYESFALTPTTHDNQSEATSGKRQRHLRSIESVTCTADGSYAIILCSDNCVLLYSVCDVFGKGMHPTSVHCSPLVPIDDNDNNEDGTFFASQSSRHHHQRNLLNRSSGFLTILFQTTDLIKLELSISYTENSISNMCSCCASPNSYSSSHPESNVNTENNNQGIRNPNQTIRPHKSPSNVVISMAFWLIASPAIGGVLKSARLTTTATSTFTAGGQAQWTCNSLAPSTVTISGIGVNRSPTTTPVSARGRSSHGHGACRQCICGDDFDLHWPAVDEFPWSPSLALENGPAVISGSNKRRRDATVDPANPALTSITSPEPAATTSILPQATEAVAVMNDQTTGSQQIDNGIEEETGFRVSDALEALRAASTHVDTTISDKNKSKKAPVNRSSAPVTESRKSTGKTTVKESIQPKVTTLTSSSSAKITSTDSTLHVPDDDLVDAYYDEYDDFAPQIDEASDKNGNDKKIIKDLQQALEESKKNEQDSKNEISRVLRKADIRFGREQQFRNEVNVSMKLV